MLYIFLIFLLRYNSLSHSFSFCCHYMDFPKRRSNQTFLYLIPVETPPPPTFSSQSARKFSNNPTKCALLQPCITADSAYPEKRDKKGEICKICCSLHKTQRSGSSSSSHHCLASLALLQINVSNVWGNFLK